MSYTNSPYATSEDEEFDDGPTNQSKNISRNHFKMWLAESV